MSNYRCSSADCVVKQLAKSGKKDNPFVPFRLLVCGHSVCELCIVELCKQNKSFIKCENCSFNTTLNESIKKNAIQSEADIKRWLNSSISPAQIMTFDTNLFPLDFIQIGNAVQSGSLTATKTAEMVDLDLDDESVPNNLLTAFDKPVNSFIDDDSTVKSIVSRIPNTAPKKFQESVEEGVKAFCDLSANHMSIKRTSDETKEWFKKTKLSAKEMFHKMHSILQIREKDLLAEIDSIGEQRQQELTVFMNEILSKRSELKGKLMQIRQIQVDKDRQRLRRDIDQLVKNSNTLPINSPQNDYKFAFVSEIESQLKGFGKLERLVTTVQSETMSTTESESMETPISLSSDEEEDEEIEVNGETNSEEEIVKDLVTVLFVDNPNRFYVHKEADKEKFEHLNRQLTSLYTSVYSHSPAIELLPPGARICAYSVLKDRWCRATYIVFKTETHPKTHEQSYLAKVFLIDFGIEETVNWYNIRQENVELFDEKKWPPFAIRCSLYSIKPKHRWTPEAIQLFEKYVLNNRLMLYEFETTGGVKLVDLIHYDISEVTYQIPSAIEVLVKCDLAVMSVSIDFTSYSPYKCQPILFPETEPPQKLRITSVLASHVESPDLFYVQLQRQHQSLLNLIEDLNKVYNEENSSIYTYYCPKVGTACAALFDGDDKFYRALVLGKGKNKLETLVHFVDFGNKQSIKTSDLRLLKDKFCNFPIQAIPCGLIHVEPAYGFQWTEAANSYFKKIISSEGGPQILTMYVVEVSKMKTKEQKLLVVLTSYAGESSGAKINELLVHNKVARSSGFHSRPYTDERYGSHESLNSIASTSSSKASQLMPTNVSAQRVLNELVERYLQSNANIKSSLIKVKVTSVRNPSEFYVQIDIKELNDFFTNFEKELHDEYSASTFLTRDQNYSPEDDCVFKIRNDWRRGRVIKRLEPTSSVPEEPNYSVFDIDYGNDCVVRVQQMRTLSEKFKNNCGFALKCKLRGLRPTGGDKWSLSAKDHFSEFVKNFGTNLCILVKERVDSEPIPVKLYSKSIIIPGAFEKEKTVYTSVNSEMIDKGLATYDRSSGDNFDNETEDDLQLNSDTNSVDQKISMPFPFFSSIGGVLDTLKQSTSSEPLRNGQHFKYLDEIYPNVQTFYGFPTDLRICKEFIINFRQFFEGLALQPAQSLEKCIQDEVERRGEPEQFVPPFTKGAACTAYFDFDKTWNRAEIVGVSQNNEDNVSKLVIRYVDYGNDESILVDKLSSEVFGRDIPKLALRCEITGIVPKNEAADKEIRNILYTRVLDHKCRFFWENYPKLPMKASLDIPDTKGSEDYVPLVSVLEGKQLLAVNQKEGDDKVEDMLTIHNLILSTYGLYPIVFIEDNFYEAVISAAFVGKYAFFQLADMKRELIGREHEINHLHDNFLQMHQQMRSEVKNYRSLTNPTQGQPCVALWDEDNCWYRGLVIGVNHLTKSAQIFFVDYGNIELLAFQNLKEIPKNHMKVSAFAVFCQFYNIRPANGQSWARNKDLVDQMANHLTVVCDSQKLFAKFKSNHLPLNIDLYLCDEQNQTQPGTHVFQEFVDKGFIEFCDPRAVWRKPIDVTKSYRNLGIKTERVVD